MPHIYVNKPGTALVQIMACHLFDTKPLPEPVLVYCKFDFGEQFSVRFESEFAHFHSGKCTWKCCLPEWRPFCPGGDELIQQLQCCIICSLINTRDANLIITLSPQILDSLWCRQVNACAKTPPIGIDCFSSESLFHILPHLVMITLWEMQLWY